MSLMIIGNKLQECYLSNAIRMLLAAYPHIITYETSILSYLYGNEIKAFIYTCVCMCVCIKLSFLCCK